MKVEFLFRTMLTNYAERSQREITFQILQNNLICAALNVGLYSVNALYLSADYIISSKQVVSLVK